jgi:hypothetical protein
MTKTLTRHGGYVIIEDSSLSLLPIACLRQVKATEEYIES